MLVQVAEIGQPGRPVYSSLLPADPPGLTAASRSLLESSSSSGPPSTPPSSCAGHEAEVDAPNYTNRTAKHNPLIDRNPYKANQADRRPEFVPVLDHWPHLLLAILPDHVPCALRAERALLLCIDVTHECNEHECIDYSADCLIKQEFDQDVLRALLGLCRLDRLHVWVVGGRGNICRE